MKLSKFFVVLTFSLFFSTLCYAAATTDMICDKTIFAYHSDICKLYKSFQNELLTGYKANNPEAMNTLKELKENLKQFPILYSYSELSDNELIEQLENWDTNGFFVPTGLLEASLSSDGNFFFKLEAKIDTDFIMDKILSNLPDDCIKKENNKVTIIPVGIDLKKNSDGTIEVKFDNNLTFDIKQDGIMVNKLPADKKPANKSWNTFINSMSDQNCLMHAEADSKALYNLLKEKNIINYLPNKEFADYITNTSRFRFVIKEKNSVIMLAVINEETRNKILNFYNTNSLLIQPLLTSSLGKTSLINKAPWIGFQTENKSNYIASLGLIYVVKTTLQACSNILLNTLSNSSEIKTKICQNITSQLTLAIESYNQDNEDKITEIDDPQRAKELIEILVREGYLKQTLECPETGDFNYFSKGDLSANGYISCKTHESPFDNLTEEEIAEIKANFIMEKTAYEILICYLNIKDLTNRVGEYNNKNQDMITEINSNNSGEILKKLYKSTKDYPLCPKTKKFSFFSNGNLAEGYQIECEAHGLPETENYDQILNEIEQE